ncbi:hypothetical protein GCM10008965_05780 [Methylorubrum aminovorans]
MRGAAEVTVNQAVTLVHENETIYLPIGSVHRLANRGKISLSQIEMQAGGYTGKHYLIRIGNMYGRSEDCIKYMIALHIVH